MNNNLHKSTSTPIYGIESELEQQLHQFLASNSKQKFLNQILKIHPSDVANFIATTNHDRQELIFDLLQKKFNPEILPALNRSLQYKLFLHYGIEQSANIISQLDLSDQIYVIEHLDEESQSEILQQLSPAAAQKLRDSLSYPEGSVGRIMHKEIVTIMQSWTIDQVIDFLSNNKAITEDYHDLYVIDYQHRPVGMLPLCDIFAQNRSTRIKDIMRPDFVTIAIDTDSEDASKMFTQYELSSAPVVNQHGRLIGVVTLDEIVTVIEEAAEEDILYLGGVTHAEEQSDPTIKIALNRVPWLIINLIVAFVNSSVIKLFDDQIEKLVVLAAIMPVVASIGGSVGTQTVTVVVRAIANGLITSSNRRRVIVKEIGASWLNSLLLCLLGSGIILLFFGDMKLVLVFCTALSVNICLAGLLGSSLPIILDRLKFDPAIASSVFLTMLTDIIGFFVFLGTAAIMYG